MSGKIPATWVQCEIGHVAEVVGEATPASKDVTNFTHEGGVPWLTPADLSGYRQMYIGRGSRNLTQRGFDNCSAKMLPPHSILFSSRAPVGYVAIAANPVCTSQGFKSFVLHPELESRFVYYYLRFIRPVAESQATGTTFKELSGAAAARLPFVVAPLNEQERIADKLDALVARVDACRERLDRVPAILKRFRQAVLAAATSGKLTEEWREEANAGIWSAVSVEQIAEQVFDGPFGSHLKSKDYSETGVRVVRLENIGWLKFITDKRTFIPVQKYHLLQRHTLRADDILLSSFLSEQVRVCLLPVELSENAINKADCFCIRLDRKKCSPQFVAMQLASRSTFIALDEQVHGATRPRINLGQLKAFILELPPLIEQDEIVRRVETLFAYADRIEARYAAARAQVERLTPALLAKAFHGELVPQDPNHEPASVLLERIRAARAAAPPKPRSRQVTGRPTKTQKAEILMPNRRDIPDAHLCTILRECGPLTAEALWSASQLDIDDFYDQLKDEEARGLLKECRGDAPTMQRLLAAAA